LQQDDTVYGRDLEQSHKEYSHAQAGSPNNIIT